VVASSRPATASPRRTSPGTRPGSGRPIPAPVPSRSRRSSPPRPTARRAEAGSGRTSASGSETPRRPGGASMSRRTRSVLPEGTLDVVLVDELAAGRRSSRGEVAAGAGVDGQVHDRGMTLDVVLVDELAAGRRVSRGEVAAGAGVDGQVRGSDM